MGSPEATVPNQTKLAIDACLQNAEHLLSACKDVRKPGQIHIAYHLAALALEEVGKASMIAVSSLNRLSPTDNANSTQWERRPIDWIEDHKRKLFWALWLPTFAGHKVTITEFSESQALAKRIHELRLATLYVDPVQMASRQEISDHDLDALISMTQARLHLELTKGFHIPDESTQRDLDWFFQAVGDQQLQMIVLGESRLAKLTEFGGDGGKWLAWLRNLIDEINRTNRQLAESALRDSEPKDNDGNEPKWQIKIRLKSWSHWIAPKQLTPWNKHSKWIKLFPTPDKKELIVQFTLGKL